MDQKIPLGKCAWITGASSGIGLAIALKLQNRVNMLALSSRHEINIEAQITRFDPKNNNSIITIPCDVSSRASIASARSRIADLCKDISNDNETGLPDILINSAGACYFASAWEYSDEQIDEMLNANLAGLIYCSRAVLPGMMKVKRGVIVNILSVASVKTFTNCSAYAATKAGALAFSRSMREEARAYNVKVIDILAGAAATSLWPAESLQAFEDRMMQPDDIAETVVAALELARLERLSIEEILVRPRLGDL